MYNASCLSDTLMRQIVLTPTMYATPPRVVPFPRVIGTASQLDRGGSRGPVLLRVQGWGRGVLRAWSGLSPGERGGCFAVPRQDLGDCNQFARELSRSFPLSHHVWGIGGDNVGLIQSTKAPPSPQPLSPPLALSFRNLPLALAFGCSAHASSLRVWG